MKAKELLNALEGLKIYLNDMNKSYLYISEAISKSVNEQYHEIKTIKTGVSLESGDI